MLKVSDIKGVQITLNVGSCTSLYIMLADDGSINRIGDGSVNFEKKAPLYIGFTQDKLFERLMTNIDENSLKFMGGYDVPEKLGIPCELKILFGFLDDSVNGFVFRYGSESKGVPIEIRNFVDAAVNLTNPWFQSCKKTQK